MRRVLVALLLAALFVALCAGIGYALSLMTREDPHRGAKAGVAVGGFVAVWIGMNEVPD